MSTHSDDNECYTPPRGEDKAAPGDMSVHDYHTPSLFGGGTRDEGRRRVWRRAPPGDHVTVTDSDGVRVYLRLRPSTRLTDREEVVAMKQSDCIIIVCTLQSSRRWDSSRAHLLSVPFALLRKSVEEQV